MPHVTLLSPVLFTGNADSVRYTLVLVERTSSFLANVSSSMKAVAVGALQRESL
jgi:hypothetical protein